MEDVEDLPVACGYCGNRETDNCCWVTQKRTLKRRVDRLEQALPDPDKLVWLATWLDKVNAVVTAYVEHHDETCEQSRGWWPDGRPCGDLGPGEERDRLLKFMDDKVQGDLLEYARRIKEAQGG